MVFNNKTITNEAVFDIEQDANNQKASISTAEIQKSAPKQPVIQDSQVEQDHDEPTISAYIGAELYS
jgi:hypothetical protein